MHAFADDNQLYIHCQVEDVQSATASIENCVRAIEHWMAANRLRLNPEKTGPISPHLTSVESLESYSLQTCRWTSTLLHSVPSASSSCDNYAASDVRSTTTPSPHWCMRLSPAASITVSVYWLVLLRRRQTSCNASSTRLRESYRTAASTTED